jgi:hypothetical protein
MEPSSSDDIEYQPLDDEVGKKPASALASASNSISEPSPLDTANPFSRWLFFWMGILLSLGFSRILEVRFSQLWIIIFTQCCNFAIKCICFLCKSAKMIFGTVRSEIWSKNAPVFSVSVELKTSLFSNRPTVSRCQAGGVFFIFLTFERRQDCFSTFSDETCFARLRTFQQSLMMTPVDRATSNFYSFILRKRKGTLVTSYFNVFSFLLSTP